MNLRLLRPGRQSNWWLCRKLRVEWRRDALKAETKPDCMSNDLRRETMVLVADGWHIHAAPSTAQLLMPRLCDKSSRHSSFRYPACATLGPLRPRRAWRRVDRRHRPSSGLSLWRLSAGGRGSVLLHLFHGHQARLAPARGQPVRKAAAQRDGSDDETSRCTGPGKGASLASHDQPRPSFAARQSQLGRRFSKKLCMPSAASSQPHMSATRSTV